MPSPPPPVRFWFPFYFRKLSHIQISFLTLWFEFPPTSARQFAAKKPLSLFRKIPINGGGNFSLGDDCTTSQRPIPQKDVCKGWGHFLPCFSPRIFCICCCFHFNKWTHTLAVRGRDRGISPIKSIRERFFPLSFFVDLRLTSANQNKAICGGGGKKTFYEF